MFIHKSQNEEGEDMLSKANAKIELSLFWAVHSEALVFSFTKKTVGLDNFEALAVFSICVDVSPQKSEKLPHKLVVPRY